MNLSYKYKKGFSLLEILLVLAVAAAIMISAFVIYPKVKSHNNMMNEVRNIGTIVAAAKQLYAGKPNYEGLTGMTLVYAGALPESLLIDGIWIKNSWNGQMSISNGNGFAGSNSTFQIQDTGVPVGECYVLGMKIYSTFKEMLDQFMINNKIVYIRTWNGNGYDFSTDLLETACAANSNKSDIYMTFF